jgi:thioesterase domain-containing protein
VNKAPMNEQELEKQIHETFPIAKSMGLRVNLVSSTHSELFFPLTPNHNNVGTAFGGCVYSAAIFACYALYRKLLADYGIEEGKFLNQKAEMEYAAPTTKDFIAKAEIAAAAEDVQRFLQGMRRRGMGHLPMKAAILVDEKPVAHFRASFLMTPLGRSYFQEIA